VVRESARARYARACILQTPLERTRNGYAGKGNDFFPGEKLRLGNHPCRLSEYRIKTGYPVIAAEYAGARIKGR